MKMPSKRIHGANTPQTYLPSNTLFRTYASSVADNAMLDYIRKCCAEIRPSGISST